MTQLTGRPAAPPHPELDAQALIEEARRHRRQRWRWAGLSLVVVVVIAAAVGVSLGGGSGSQAPRPVKPKPSTSAAATSPSPTSPVPPTTAWVSPGGLTDASCQGQSCVAVGYSNVTNATSVATQAGSAAGRVLVSGNSGRTWSAGIVPGGVGELLSVTCPSVSFCLAVGLTHTTGPTDGTGVVLVSGDGGHSWQRASVPADTGSLQSVSCVSGVACVAVGAPTTYANSTGDAVLDPFGHPVASPGIVLAASTVDGGRTWTASSLPATVVGLGAVSCTAGRLCMATGVARSAGSGGAGGADPVVVVVSHDGGASWSVATQPAGINPYDHAPSTVDLGGITCWAGTHCITAGDVNGDRVSEAFVTEDGGRSWTMAGGWGADGGEPLVGSPDSFWCTAQGRCLAVADSEPHSLGAVLSSDDGGVSWTADYSGTGVWSGGSIACSSALACVAVGESGDNWMEAAWTADGGRTWADGAVPDGLGPLQAVSCWSSTGCTAVGDTADEQGSVLVTGDAGRTWSASVLPVGTPGLGAVSCPTSDDCYAARTDAEGSTVAVLRSTDEGTSWTMTPTQPAGPVNAMVCPSATTCWAVGGGGDVSQPALVTITSDAGNSWQTVPVAAGVSELTALSCSSPDLCLAVGAGPGPEATPVVRLEISPSGSADATVIGSVTGVPKAQSITCVSAERCLIAGATAPGRDQRGRVLETNDGGAHWRVIERGPGRSQDVEAVACPSATRCVAVGRGPSHGGAAAIVTGDGGQTWTARPIPAGVGNLSQVTCTSATHCVAVGSLVSPAGVLVSDDGGQRWEPATLPAWTLDTAPAM